MSMPFLQFTILSFVAVTATAVVLTRDPAKQAIGISFYGLVMALMFFIFQAPDVALSQIVIGAVALPLMILLALTKVRRHEEEQHKRHKGKRAA
jgi:energy-converting hydrogenase B subunit D